MSTPSTSPDSLPEVPALLVSFREAGVLGALDQHFAVAVGRLGNEANPAVLLAVALASRSPRAGHTCVDLHTIQQAIRLDTDQDLGALAWPEPDLWLPAVAESPLVTDPSSPHAAPLVLDGSRLHLQRYWRYQDRLVHALQERATGAAPAVHLAGLQQDLATWFPPDPALEGAPDLQRLAALVAILRRFTVISGGPGTGKTTTVLKVLLLAASQHRHLAAQGLAAFPPRIRLLAPTGKAAARLKESLDDGLSKLKSAPDPELVSALPEQATTIHRALGWQPRSPTVFRHSAANPLAADLVVVDEASMVDLALFTKLVEAVPPRARLILLGDRDQLASVEAGAVLGDICGVDRTDRQGPSAAFRQQVEAVTGEAFPELDAPPAEAPGLSDCLVHLTRTWRFGPQSGIGTLARAVNAGDAEAALAFLRRERTDHPDGLPYSELHLEELAPAGAYGMPARLVAQLVEAWRPALEATLPAVALAAMEQTRVLCAHRRGQLGLEGVNRALQEALEAAELIAPRGPVWSGRPVLVRRNDPELGLFNGDVGLLMADPDEADHAVWAWFPGAPGEPPRRLHPARLPAHDTVFAMTVHQSQGSQFVHPVVILPRRPSPILTRELLYTGITRARRQVTVVGSEAAIRAAVEGRVVRQSGLGEALWGPGAQPE